MAEMLSWQAQNEFKEPHVKSLKCCTQTCSKFKNDRCTRTTPIRCPAVAGLREAELSLKSKWFSD